MIYVRRILLLSVIALMFSGMNTHVGPWGLAKLTVYEDVTPEVEERIQRPIPIGGINMEGFKKQMAHLESGGILKPYKAINRYGYMGKYQFGKRTLRGLVRTGYLKATKKELRNFRGNPQLQERAMEALVRSNTNTLKNYGLIKYIGTKVNNIEITMEGMLAASHLLGPYAVKHYIKTNGSLKTVKVNGISIRKYDGNGTSLEHYLKQFEVNDREQISISSQRYG